MSLAETIVQQASALPEGQVVNARLFLHLASRAAVDQALSRLAKQGKLMRLTRGAYVAPVAGRFGSRPPAAEKAIQSLAEIRGEIIASHGAAAANMLGLTTQVPTREVFITSGRTRQLMLGSRLVELRHAPKWELLFAGREAGNAVRALAWLGRRNAARNGMKLKERISPSEWEALAVKRAAFPGWLAKAVGEATNA